MPKKEGQSEEIPANQKVFSIDLVKFVKWSNFIIGIYLVVSAVLNTIAFTNAVFSPFTFILTLYEGLFGCLMVFSSAFPKMKCIRNNFLFLLTGKGKGTFNIFVGCILFFANAVKTSGRNVVTDVAGYVCVGSGLGMIFLSVFKMTSEAWIDDKNMEIKMSKEMKKKVTEQTAIIAADQIEQNLREGYLNNENHNRV